MQQWTLGVQQEIKGNIVEVRYVGNHSVGGVRAFDYNQVIIRENGFLEDFNRARRNGFLALASGGVFNPAYDSRIAGSQQLTVFPNLWRQGQLTSNTYRNLIESGQPGQLAATYQINDSNGSVQFFPNPVALGADYLTNYSHSTYNALQAEVRRRTRGGLDFQANYTFSRCSAIPRAPASPASSISSISPIQKSSARAPTSTSPTSSRATPFTSCPG